MKVFCALMTMTGRFGRIFLIRGNRSNAFSSGITTSVMTRSPSPWLTQRHSVAALPVRRTSYPARERAWFRTVRMAVSSSATSMLPAGIVIPHLASCEAGGGVPGTPSRLLWSNCLVGLNIGSSTRKVVFRGWDSHSMMPP